MARIQTAAVSVKVYSKNHATDTVLLPSSNDGQATVKYTSTTFLKKDFCLVIRTSIQSEASRCFAERRVADHDSVAMHLTFIPQFTSEAGEAEEYIFIIDRSGSMSGNPIRQATDTLAVLLKALPQGDTNFNVFCFGSTWHSIFSSNSSRLHTEETLQTAVSSTFHQGIAPFVAYHMHYRDNTYKAWPLTSEGRACSLLSVAYYLPGITMSPHQFFCLQMDR